MNSEWSSLVRVYSFQRVFQLVCCKGVIGGLRYRFSSALGKAGWHWGGGGELRLCLAESGGGHLPDLPQQMLPFSIYYYAELKEEWVSINDKAILVATDAVFQWDSPKCQVNPALKQSG